MGVVDDVLKAFDRIPIWRRMQEIPAEVEDLRRRVAALEALTEGKALPDACPFCGTRSFRLVESMAGGDLEYWKCYDEACGKVQEKRPTRR